MTFAQTDVFVGMIAYFSIDDLRGDTALRKTGGSPDWKPRPFVCYAMDSDGDYFWTPITTDDGQPGRTHIEARWIQNAVGKLRDEPQIANDGQHTYAGPTARFAAHSLAHDKFSAPSRPWLTPEGVKAVSAAVLGRGGLLPKL